MNWFRKFMAGRYGMDQLSSALVMFAFVLVLISSFTKLQIIYLVSVVFMILAYYRVFSRNINKRILENKKFLDGIRPITSFFKTSVNMFKDRKDYKHFRCNVCKQIIRIPKGKGRVSITCPKCKNKMIRKA